MANITNAPETITIRTVLNGYRVEVGCQEVVFESRKRMLKEIGRYLKNPNKVEAEYCILEDVPLSSSITYATDDATIIPHGITRVGGIVI